MAAEEAREQQASSDPIMAALIGAVASALTQYLAGIDPIPRILIAIGLALLYQRLGPRIFGRRFAGEEEAGDSKQTKANVFSIILGVAAIFFLIEDTLLGYDLLSILVVLLAILAVIVLTQIVARSATASTATQAIALSLAAATAGAVIGGSLPPIVETIAEPRANLQVSNGCADRLEADIPLILSNTLDVPGGETQDTEALRITLEARYDENSVEIRPTLRAGGSSFTFEDSRITSVTFNGEELGPDEWHTISFRDKDENLLEIECG